MLYSQITQFIEDMFSFPTFTSQLAKIHKRNFKVFRKSWFPELLAVVLEPTLLFLIVGIGVGLMVEQTYSLKYLDFLFPGFLSFLAFNISYIEACYGVKNRLETKGVMDTLKLSPVRSEDIAYGELLWSASKSIIAILLLTLVYLLVSKNINAQLIPVVSVSVLMAWIGACFGLMVSSSSRRSNSTIYIYTLYILPFSMICNVFFPANLLPKWLYYLSFISPVTHGANVAHDMSNTTISFWFYVHLAIIFGFFVLFTNLSVMRFTRATK